MRGLHREEEWVERGCKDLGNVMVWTSRLLAKAIRHKLCQTARGDQVSLAFSSMHEFSEGRRSRGMFGAGNVIQKG